MTFLKHAALALPLALIWGCGDDGGGNNNDRADAAVGQADANLETPDAAAQADADLTPDAAPPGMVTVTVLDLEGAPAAGADVVFHGADGTVISHVTTDDLGKATETVPGGAMVTLAQSQTDRYALFTITGVQPGDDITLEGAGFPTAPAPAKNITVDWPGAFDGATAYAVSDGCVSDAPEMPDESQDYDVRCLVEGTDTFHLIAQAEAEAGFPPLPQTQAYSAVLGTAVAAGEQTVALPAWSEAFTTVSVPMANKPAGGLLAGDAGFYIDGQYFDFGDLAIIQGPFAYNGKLPDGLTLSATEVATLHLSVAGMALSGQRVVIKNVAGAAAEVAFDLGAEMLPEMTLGTFDDTDPARPVLAWTVGGDASAANLQQINLPWLDAGALHTWTVLRNPTSAPSFRLPALPDALSAYAPTAAAVYQSDLPVVYFSGDWITDDWDTLRQAGGDSSVEQPATGFMLNQAAPAFSLVPEEGAKIATQAALVRAAATRLDAFRARR